ncbi:LysR family transcriptional regulator [Saccharibacillus sp. CPCC 101409]|uniref:LysR family transcriptional regulator n=1 Tax=Saccharibacillus sp. CPCC 101409 TaxID=3058041 RepID=UPI002672533F|nr:LysR family transcriptional regulator [Saccharibacillus sp. CPCC 101409]MDO3408475.1 LysR family transcriptional regulator [Saccharibacillus sp. CPCC 101409]
MDMLDLKVFIAIAESGSMSKAARGVSLSQPAVSFRVANMEAELGAPLFNRTRAGAFLTEAGRRFYYYANYALSAFEVGRQAVQDTVRETESGGPLRIGMVESRIPLLLPPLSETLEEAGENNWTLRTGESVDLAVRTASGELDLAFIHHISFPMSQLEFRKLFEEPIVLIGPRRGGSPLYQSLSSYVGSEAFVLLKRGMPLRELLEDRLFGPLRLKPSRLIEVDTSNLIRRLVAQGSGYSFLPVSSLWGEENLPKIRMLPLREVGVTQSLHAVYPAELQGDRRELIAAACDHISRRIEEMRAAHAGIEQP